VEARLELEAVLAAIQETFREVLGDDTVVLATNTTADDVNAWDSLTNIQLMIGIEQRFGVRFTAQEIQSYRNVGDLCAAVQRKAGGES